MSRPSGPPDRPEALCAHRRAARSTLAASFGDRCAPARIRCPGARQGHAVWSTSAGMKVFLVSHTHWDREWYRTFQAFRARLVDAIDRVLELVAADDGFRFLLDGQTIAIEDYLEVRPGRRAALEAACRAGRIAIGPWYVQPDSLLPSGEAHVRNLLEGRRVGEAIGPVSTVAYTPDSFGHPAQLPQIFRGFALEPFVYWRGNGDEIDTLPAEYLWEAPDGSAVLAHHLGEGYFAASGLPARTTRRRRRSSPDLARRLGARTRSGAVLLMNGFDHALPEAHTARAARALARAHRVTRCGARCSTTSRRRCRARRRATAASCSARAPRTCSPACGRRACRRSCATGASRASSRRGPSRGARSAARSARPTSARRCAPAWRELLQNQAHDSICGCSQDRVHEQMEARYDTAEELGARDHDALPRAHRRASTRARATPWADAVEIAVFNPSPHPRSDVVRFALSPARWLEFRGDGGARHMALHPLLRAGSARPRASRSTASRRAWSRTTTRARIRLLARARAAQRRVRRRATCPRSAGGASGCAPAAAAPRGRGRRPRDRARRRVGARRRRRHARRRARRRGAGAGLCALEDIGDRGDTYDFDPVAGGAPEVTRSSSAPPAARERHRAPAACAACFRCRRRSPPTGARAAPQRVAADGRRRGAGGARRAARRPAGAPRQHARAITACACCFRPAGRSRDVRRGDDLRRRAPQHGAARRPRLGASRAGDVPAAGLRQRRRAHRGGAGSARGRGDARRRRSRSRWCARSAGSRAWT